MLNTSRVEISVGVLSLGEKPLTIFDGDISIGERVLSSVCLDSILFDGEILVEKEKIKKLLSSIEESEKITRYSFSKTSSPVEGFFNPEFTEGLCGSKYWKRYQNTQVVIFEKLIIDNNHYWMTISFNRGNNLIPSGKLMHNSGMKVFVNYIIDKEGGLIQSKSIESTEIITGNNKRTSLRKITEDFSVFDFNRRLDELRTWKICWQFPGENNKKQIIKTGDTTLISLSSNWAVAEKQISYIKKLYEDYLFSNQYVERFPFLDTRFATFTEEEILNEKLLKTFRENIEKVGLRWPELDENDEQTYFTFKKSKSNKSFFKVYDDEEEILFLDDCMIPTLVSDFEIGGNAEDFIKRLKRFVVIKNYPNINKKVVRTLWDCLQTELKHGLGESSKNFFLRNGKWRFYDPSFVKAVEKGFDLILEELEFTPVGIELNEWKTFSRSDGKLKRIKEDKYNEWMVKINKDNLILGDKKFVHFGQYKKIEIGDLISFYNGDVKSILAVKFNSNTGGISHLIQQVKQARNLLNSRSLDLEKANESLKECSGMNINLDKVEEIVLCIGDKKPLNQLQFMAKLCIYDLLDNESSGKIKLKIKWIQTTEVTEEEIDAINND